jgi:Peroxiredoxin
MAKLSVGDKMPNFVFNTAYETNKSVEEVIQAKKRTVFWVLRYIGCPPCRLDVQELADAYREFLDLDSQIYVVMQSEPASVREDLQDTKLPFDIICDTDMAIYKSLEIPATASREERMPADPEDIAKFEAKKRKATEAGIAHGKYEGNENQLPALFVVERDGTVSYAHYAKNSIDMPTVEEMLQVIKAL